MSETRASLPRKLLPLVILPMLGLGVLGAMGATARVAQTAPSDPDPDFNGSGWVTTVLGGTEQIHGLAVQPDDGQTMILAVGQTLSSDDVFNFTAIRYRADGSVDPAFGDGTVDNGGQSIGLIRDRFGSGDHVANAVAVQDDGGVVIAGYSDDGTQRFLDIARYTSSGRPDPTFGTTPNQPGFQQRGIGYFSPRAIVIQKSDGAIVVAGVATDGDLRRLALARFAKSGDIDIAYPSGLPDLGSFAPDAVSVSIDADGRGVVVSAISTNALVELHLKPDGSAVSPPAMLSLSAPALEHVYGLTRGRDGSYLIAGQSQNRFAVARFTRAGQPDESFGTAGVVIPDASVDGDAAYAVVEQADGKIVAGGRSGSAFALMRLLGRSAAAAAPTPAQPTATPADVTATERPTPVAASPSPSPAAAPTSSPTASAPAGTPIPSATPCATPSQTPGAMPSQTPGATASPTSRPTQCPMPSGAPDPAPIAPPS